MSNEVATAPGVDAATHKACTKCSNIKPLHDFAANASNADGKQRHCRECMKNMRGKQAGQHAPAGGILLSMSVAVIVASLTNPRKTFDAQRLAELADSIKETGLRQPILVRPLPADRIEETSQAPATLPADSKKWARPTHEIIAGERRFRAAQLAGLTIVPVVITAMTDEQVLTFQLVENLQREDLHPMEEAEGYQRLCERTGISKDEIGDKIGKSRSYVYQRLKLLNLSAAAREAFGKGMPGGIDMSRALVIARCPDTQLQEKALEHAVKADWQGEVPSVRAFQAWARQNIMLQLDSARFKITAVDLVPDAGSCRECPNRTGANPDLFADVKSADVCTDPKCFHAKEAAHDAAILARAAERGQRVIEEKEAKRLWQYEGSDINGYVRLDKPDYRVDSRKNLKSVLGKDIPEPILMANPHKGGELVEVLPRATVSDLLLERGKITAQQVRGDRVISESEAKMKALDKFERTWRKRAIAAVSEEMEKFGHAPDLWPGVLRVLALELVGGLRQDERALVADLLGLGKVAQADGIRDHLKNADALQAQDAMCILLMHHDLVNVLGYDHKVHPADRIGAVADMYQVDVKVIQAAVKAEMKDEAAAKAEKAKKSSAPAAPGGSKSEVKGKKGAAKKPPAPKTSAAEARESIAAALQAVDGGQDQAPAGAELSQGDALASPVQAADAADLDKPAALAAGAASPVAWPFPGPTLKPGVAARVSPPAKPAEVAPQYSVADKVMVMRSSDTSLIGCQGDVTAVLASGQIKVIFKGLHQPVLFKPSELGLVTAATWPTAGQQSATTPAALKIGQLGRVKAGCKGPGGKLLKTAGRVGRVVGIGSDGRVHLKHGEHHHQLVVLLPEHVEAYTASPYVGNKVRVLSVGAMPTPRNNMLWREGRIVACEQAGWRVQFPGKAGTEEHHFETDELEVLA